MACQLVEVSGIRVEDSDIEDFLWLCQAQSFNLGVETSVFGSKVGNAE
jgi:hypothetical protein